MRLPPVRSRGFGAPVSVQLYKPKVAASTVNSTYLPFTRKVDGRLAADTVVFFWSPESPRRANPPPSHPSEAAARAEFGAKAARPRASEARATQVCRRRRGLVDCIFRASEGHWWRVCSISNVSWVLHGRTDPLLRPGARITKGDALVTFTRPASCPPSFASLPNDLEHAPPDRAGGVA